jgi:hypothetical protein
MIRSTMQRVPLSINQLMAHPKVKLRERFRSV